MKKYVWILVLLLIPTLCNAGRKMIWDKNANDLLINSDGSIKQQGDAIYLPAIYQARTTNPFTLVCADTAAATMQVLASSAVITDLLAAATWFVFAESHLDTMAEFISHLNSMTGLVCARVQGSYGGDDTTDLTVVGATNIGTTAATFAIDATKGISYIVPASTLSSGEAYYIKSIIVNATYASGTTTLTVYSGTGTSTILNKETLPFSAQDCSSDIVILPGIADTAIRIDLVGTAAVSAGYMDIVLFRRIANKL